MNAQTASHGTTQTAPRHNGEDNPALLEEELNQTRSEISRTLEAIERRFAPDQLIDQVLRRWRGGPSEFASNLSESVKQNPVATALVATGLAWLMATGRSGPAAGGGRTAASAHEAKERLSSMASKTRGRASEAVDQATAAVHGAKERLSSMAAKTGSRAAEAMGQAGERAHQAGQALRHQGERAREYYGYMLREQPLVVGALGLALGALLGAGLPESRTESKLAGGKEASHPAGAAEQNPPPPVIQNPTAHDVAGEFRQTSPEKRETGSAQDPSAGLEPGC